MKRHFLILAFCCSLGWAQEMVVVESTEEEKRRPVYFKLDISTPLRENPYRDEIDPKTGESGYWYLPDGLNARFGTGYMFSDYFGIGASMGIDWKAAHKIVSAPVFGEIRLNPQVGPELRFHTIIGYGRTFALGRGNLSGEFQRFAMGFGNLEGSCLFAEFTVYGFQIHEMRRYGSFCIGVSIAF